MRWHLSGLVVAATLVTGCTLPWQEDEADYGNMASVIEAAGCETAQDEDTMLFAAETVTCKLPTARVTINWFNNNDARDRYVDVGMSNGATYVIGDNWAIECEDHAIQADIAAATKGETQG